MGYTPPQIFDYGTLVEMTSDGGAMAHVGLGGGLGAAGVSTPLVPGGGGGIDAGTNDNGVLGQGDSGGDGVGGTDGGGGGGAGGTSGGGGSGGGGGGGGKLPFTGFAVGAIGAAGAGISAAGLALRERLRRKS